MRIVLRPLAVWAVLGAAACLLGVSPKVGANVGQPNDRERIQGKWKFVSVLEGGKAQPMPEGNRVVITSDTLRIEYPKGDPMGWNYTIDPSKNPKEMDWIVEIDPGHPIRQLAIYSLDGDTLTIASAAAGKPRPTTFQSKEGDFGGVMTLRRDAAPLAQAH